METATDLPFPFAPMASEYPYDNSRIFHGT